MSDTPDVDSAAFEERGLPGSLVVQADFARRLRRSLDAQILAHKLLAVENTELAAKIALGEERYKESQKLLERQQQHSLDLQAIIYTLCSDQPLPTTTLAKTELETALAFQQQLAERHKNAEAARDAAEKSWAQRILDAEKAARDAAEASVKEIAALTQQVADLQLRVEAQQEVTFELAAKLDMHVVGGD